MPPNLHLDPVALRAATTSIEALLPVLCFPGLGPADLDALVRVPGGARLVAEHDRLAAALARTGRDLAELVVGLGVAARQIASAEHDAVRCLQEVAR